MDEQQERGIASISLLLAVVHQKSAAQRVKGPSDRDSSRLRAA